MPTFVCSMFFSSQSQKEFGLPQPDNFHYQMYYLPASDPKLCEAKKTLGVILQGKHFMHHVVLILKHNSDWKDSCVSAFEEKITICDGMPVPCTSQCSIVQSSTRSDMSCVMGIIPHPFQYIGLVVNDNISDGLGRNEPSVSADLCRKIALMKEPRRKEVLDPVVVKDKGQLTPRDTHDAAYKWIRYHGNNIAKVDFIQKDGSIRTKRRLMVKNGDDFVNARTLSDCLNYVQNKTGRDFRKDMLENGDIYGLK